MLWGGREVKMSKTEVTVVELLASSGFDGATFAQVYGCVKPPGFIAGNGTAGWHANVRAIIKRIREKFRMIDPAFERIENYSGVGYRWKQAP